MPWVDAKLAWLPDEAIKGLGEYNGSDGGASPSEWAAEVLRLRARVRELERPGPIMMDADFARALEANPDRARPGAVTWVDDPRDSR